MKSRILINLSHVKNKRISVDNYSFIKEFISATKIDKRFMNNKTCYRYFSTYTTTTSTDDDINTNSSNHDPTASSSSSSSSTKSKRIVQKLEDGDRTVVIESELHDLVGGTHGVATLRLTPEELSIAAFNNKSNLKLDNNEQHHDSTEVVTSEELDRLLQDTSDYPKGYGVFRESENDDVQVLLNYFTAPALARALRDREQTLQICARLLFTYDNDNNSNNDNNNKNDNDNDNDNNDDLIKLKEMLYPFTKANVMKRRGKKRPLDLSTSVTRNDLVILQRYLHRMPRQVFTAREKRASVVIPLCNDNGVASILFQRRNLNLRKHSGEICFPGGMVDEDADSTIIQTSLRETSEELGIPRDQIDVLGILRCNWSEVEHMTGIAVTPVVGFLGELNDIHLNPNPDEVQEYFTVPIKKILKEDKWIVKDGVAPVFTGGPYVIWGLTGYLLRAFIRDVVKRTHFKGIDDGR